MNVGWILPSDWNRWLLNTLFREQKLQFPADIFSYGCLDNSNTADVLMWFILSVAGLNLEQLTLPRSDAGASLLTNDSPASERNMCCHWPKHLRENQNPIIIQGQSCRSFTLSSIAMRRAVCLVGSDCTSVMFSGPFHRNTVMAL